MMIVRVASFPVIKIFSRHGIVWVGVRNRFPDFPDITKSSSYCVTSYFISRKVIEIAGLAPGPFAGVHRKEDTMSITRDDSYDANSIIRHGASRFWRRRDQSR